jgi:hypothetical protein
VIFCCYTCLIICQPGAEEDAAGVGCLQRGKGIRNVAGKLC